MKRNVDIHDLVYRRKFVQRFRLSDVPRKPVEQITVRAVGFFEPCLDYLYRYFVGDELTFVYIGFRLNPDRSTFFDVFSENIARGHVRDFKTFGKSYCLRAFTRAGRP